MEQQFSQLAILVLNGVYSRIIKRVTFFENRRQGIIVFKKEIILQPFLADINGYNSLGNINSK